jgi:hypothetical protein
MSIDRGVARKRDAASLMMGEFPETVMEGGSPQGPVDYGSASRCRILASIGGRDREARHIAARRPST